MSFLLIVRISLNKKDFLILFTSHFTCGNLRSLSYTPNLLLDYVCSIPTSERIRGNSSNTQTSSQTLPFLINNNFHHGEPNQTKDPRVIFTGKTSSNLPETLSLPSTLSVSILSILNIFSIILQHNLSNRYQELQNFS